jgi:L-asparagine transporter-like permease
MTGKIVVIVALIVVSSILVAGLYTLFRGGDISRSWSNRLMRLRVLAQFIAILIIIAVAYFTGHL